MATSKKPEYGVSRIGIKEHRDGKELVCGKCRSNKHHSCTSLNCVCKECMEAECSIGLK